MLALYFPEGVAFIQLAQVTPNRRLKSTVFLKVFF